MFHSSFTIRWLYRTQRVVNELISLMHGIQSGVWMGCLRDETFQATDIYPYLTVAVDGRLGDADRGLESWEQTAIDEHFASCQSLLLAAAGGTRELQALARRSIELECFDFDSTLVEVSNQHLAAKGLTLRIQHQPRFEIPTENARLDGAIVARKFFSLIHDRDRRIQFLRALRSRLKDQAPLLLSFYPREDNGLEWRLNVWIAKSLRLLTGNSRQAVEIGDHLDTHSPLFHHHFTEAELVLELSTAGFSLKNFTSAGWFGYAIAEAQPTAITQCSVNLQDK